MNRDGRPVILVGLSGSCASLAALAWAAQEAQRRAARIRVIQAWQPHPARAPYAGTGRYAGLRADSEPMTERAAADRLAADLRSALGASASGVSAELAEGAAERVLIHASAGADLLVLGTGAPSPLSQHDPLINDRPVGPVIRACLSHARCPVVVIGPHTGDGPAAPGSHADARLADHSR